MGQIVGGSSYTIKHALSDGVYANLNGFGANGGAAGIASAGVHGCVLLVYRVPTT